MSPKVRADLSAYGDEPEYCPNCGSTGYPEFQVSGSTLAEIVLWLVFLLPGILYSIWRNSTKRWVCPKCWQEGMIPLDSPMAQKAISAKG
jgi:hypothetical protein